MTLGGMAQRDLASFLGVSRTTLVRRFRFLAKEARERHAKSLDLVLATQGQFENLQYDEPHTFEHSKCKPKVIGLVLTKKRRFILGFSVAQIPASGPLTAVSRKKYGYRVDHSNQKHHELFSKLAPYIAANATIGTDKYARY